MKNYFGSFKIVAFLRKKKVLWSFPVYVEYFMRCDNFFKASETFLIIKVQEKVLNK